MGLPCYVDQHTPGRRPGTGTWHQLLPGSPIQLHASNWGSLRAQAEPRASLIVRKKLAHGNTVTILPLPDLQQPAQAQGFLGWHLS